MTGTSRIELIGVPGLPFVQSGDDLAGLIAQALIRCNMLPSAGDVLVVAQKVVSKAEGRFVDLASVLPSDRAMVVAAQTGKDPRLVEVILSESRRIVRQARNVLVTEHRLGYVMANAGVDQSNVGPSEGTGRVLLLPLDPDGSAESLRRRLSDHFACDVAVIINDSFGRPWRRGTTGVALGAAGFPAIVDLRGRADLFGRRLMASQVALADEVAAAASLVMGQAAEGMPVILVRGVAWTTSPIAACSLIRPTEEDLFR